MEEDFSVARVLDIEDLKTTKDKLGTKRVMLEFNLIKTNGVYL